MPREQALVTLAGLTVFGVGFAGAGILVAADRGGSPAYWCLVALGLAGIVTAAVRQSRSPTATQRPPIWSAAGLTAVARPLGLPPRAVMVVFYLLVAIGVFGNVVTPTLSGHG